MASIKIPHIQFKVNTVVKKMPSPLIERAWPKNMELAKGLEPSTYGLQNHCSAIELRQRVLQ
tara:strand:+ start:443 stop:628 length:186 start_codon:yes stop_codon:yes gene_type:complete